MNFSLDNLKCVYVSSYRRGFFVVSDQPMCVTTASGSSGNDTIIAVKRVYREAGRWVYANPEHYGQWWLKSAWKAAIALRGHEPWRIYELDASETATRLDAGEFTDDVRGFENRGEPWQPVTVDPTTGEIDGYTTIAAARIWARVDGWRVVQCDDGDWTADGTHCNADRSILKYSRQHFDPLPEFRMNEAVEAIVVVDENRPWN